MILVGTIHVDIEGPKRLRYLLNRFNPRKISIEAPKNKTIGELEQLLLKHRENMKKEISGWNYPKPLVNFAEEIIEAYRYELLVPAEYAKNTNAKICLVDHPDVVISYRRINDFIKGFIRGYVEAVNKVYRDEGLPSSEIVIATDELRKMHVKDIDKIYFDRFSEPNSILIQSLIEAEKQEGDLGYVGTEEFKEEREQMMADGILSFQPDLHIGGLQHVFKEQAESLPVKSLYERLGDLVSRKIRLCKAEKE